MFQPVTSAVDLPRLEEEVLDFWRQHDIFHKSLALREGAPEYVFYEGPPTANGNPGIHHVQARAYKDLFPRYKTMRGFRVPRKAGWDCHGLPVEIEVEKELGLSGKKAIEEYGIEAFNRRCRESVMKYEGAWRRLTERIAFWIDLDEAYLTMSRDYVESVWWSLKRLWNQGLLFLGYKVVPYCARDGTPLSSHEVGLGYQEVEDPSLYVRFPLEDPGVLGLPPDSSLLVWTTTPWTLPGNTGAAVHPDLTYTAVRREGEVLVLAEALLERTMGEGQEVLVRFPGEHLVGTRYRAPYRFFDFGEQEGHRVVPGRFVSAEEGTGIVHLAPAFGADDLEMSRLHGLPVVHSVGPDGRFVAAVEPVAGMWFKEADPVLTEDLALRGLLFRAERYTHSYPHCWRCGQPLMYYATHSWFIHNTRLKDRLIGRNQEIDWHPPHIKKGRYGDWLENLVDWALSRSRYWGTPLPIWTCSRCEARECLGSYAELEERSGRSLPEDFDPHRPEVDEFTFPCRECGGVMRRVPDVIDCWYDSGAMPFAQFHYPFENRERFESSFPADFICEGLDQTRGWFNSLHQLGVMLFDSIAYRTVICHGLVLDAQGEKMSKSRGNVVDPWEVLNSHGADALRWYLYTSAPPESSRRFSVDLVGEARRRHLGTWWNTYHFFILNALASKPDLSREIPPERRSTLDRWILARLHQTIERVTERLDAYDVTGAARTLEELVDDLSNWYVRRSRRRIWAEDPAAFRTLYECLVTVAQLSAPFTPFLSEHMYRNLVVSLDPGAPESVHLCDWPRADAELMDEQLIADTRLALKVVSLGRNARNRSGHRVRQPLAELVVRPRSRAERESLERLAAEVQEELNVKELRFLEPDEEFVDYRVRPNLPLLGRKYGARLPALRTALESQDPGRLARQVREGRPLALEIEGEEFVVEPEEVLLEACAPAGYAVDQDAGLLVAICTELDEALELEGTARDLVRHIQEQRKASELQITDRIETWIAGSDGVVRAVEAYRETIMAETLTCELHLEEPPEAIPVAQVELDPSEPPLRIAVRRVSSRQDDTGR